jgi:hypothetical protein
MHAPAMKPIIEVAVENSPMSAWPGTIPTSHLYDFAWRSACVQKAEERRRAARPRNKGVQQLTSIMLIFFEELDVITRPTNRNGGTVHDTDERDLRAQCGRKRQPNRRRVSSARCSVHRDEDPIEGLNVSLLQVLHTGDARLLEADVMHVTKQSRTPSVEPRWTSSFTIWSREAPQQHDVARFQGVSNDRCRSTGQG